MNEIKHHEKDFSFFSLIIFLPAYISLGQSVGINDDGSAPKSSAMLDVKSTTRGLLLPRVALTSSASASPVTNPNNGLVVYDTVTAGDVTPGYYFWSGPVSGGSWQRLNSGLYPLNVVTKSATATLLKTENYVLASTTTGNAATMTLPAITSADNGLAITIKNVGTYTDLITVMPNGTSTVDGLTGGIGLTRWISRTYVADGGNWFVQEKEQRIDNEYDVSNRSSFTTIAEVISFFNAHNPATPVTIHLNPGTYTVSSTITMNFSQPITLRGGDNYGITVVNFTGSTGPAFNCTTTCYFKFINFTTNTTGIDCIDFSNSSSTQSYHEIFDCTFDNGSASWARAINITGNAWVWLFDSNVGDCTTAGVQVNYTGSYTGTELEISETDFKNNSIGIYLLQGKTPIVNITNTTFYNSTGQTGLLYVPATFSPFQSMFITNDSWNNVGTFISGFDFTLNTGRDANAFIQNNAGMPSETPHCKINVVGNTSTTTLASNTWAPAVWLLSFVTSTYVCKFTLPQTNRITYQPANSGDLYMTICGNIQAPGSNRNISFAIVKNGISTTRYGENTIRITSFNEPYQFATIVYIPSVVATDYFEIWLYDSGNSDAVLIQDLSWFTNSQ